MRRFAILLVLLCSTATFAQDTTPSAASTAGEDATSADQLIRILENDEARAALIERLKAGAAPVDEPAQAEPPSIARQIAEITRAAAEQASDLAGGLTRVLTELWRSFTGAADLDVGALWGIVIQVGMIVLLAFGVFFALRGATAIAFASMEQRAAAAGLLMRWVLAVAAAVLDLLAVAIAWGSGYVFALYLGEGGRMGINQTLFLNAFLLIESTKVLTRMALAPRYPVLRVLPMDDTNAAYWYFWTSRLLGLLGYTFLFVSPVIATNIDPLAAQSVRVIVAFTALLMGIAIVLQNRQPVRRALSGRRATGVHDPLAGMLAAVGRLWHWVAIVYLSAVFVLWLSAPAQALSFMLAATVQSLIAIAIGVLVFLFISRAMSGGMRIPEDLRERLPLLEPRLNAVIPKILMTARVVVIVVVLLAIVQAWAIIDVLGWLASESGERVSGAVVSVMLILLLAFAVHLGVSSWIEYRLVAGASRPSAARERTLLALFRNAFSIALVVLVGMLVLSELGVNIAPLLAGAGVLGLAIGFGSQKLVQDIINGAFIQFENAMNEGDVVSAGGVTGVVERLTIRSVALRDLHGVYHIVPFSSVDSVSNHTRHFGYHVAEIGVAYRENIDEVKALMHEAYDRLAATEIGESLIGPLEMHGVTQFADSAVIVRGRLKTLPGQQWAAGRAYNEFIKTVFDEHGVEIPFPHITLYMGEDKQGNAPPMRIVSSDTGTSTAISLDKPGAQSPDGPQPPEGPHTPPGEDEVSRPADT